MRAHRACTVYIGHLLQRRYFHEVGEAETNVRDIRIVLGEVWGQELKLRKAEEWVDGVVEARMDALLGTYCETYCRFTTKRYNDVKPGT